MIITDNTNAYPVETKTIGTSEWTKVEVVDVNEPSKNIPIDIKNNDANENLLNKKIPDFYCHANLEVKSLNASDGMMNIEGYASTEDLDRGQDVTLAKSFTKTLSDYMQNPILLYMHNLNYPVGKVLSADIIPDKGLLVKAAISSTEQEIQTKVKEGILKAFSFGFIINDSEYQEKDMDNGGKQKVQIIKDVELLEISIVSIPMNKRALFSLAKGMQKGTDIVCNECSCKKSKDESKCNPVVTNSEMDKADNELLDELAIKSVVPHMQYPLMPPEANWDFTSVDSDELLGEYNDWGRYGKAFAWFDSARAKTKAGYKLPHHKLDNGEIKTYWRGVASAMSALMGARTGVNIPDVDRQGVYDHLVKHYQEFDKPAPQFRSIQEIEKEELNNLNSKGVKMLSESDKETIRKTIQILNTLVSMGDEGNPPTDMPNPNNSGGNMPDNGAGAPKSINEEIIKKSDKAKFYAEVEALLIPLKKYSENMKNMNDRMNKLINLIG